MRTMFELFRSGAVVACSVLLTVAIGEQLDKDMAKDSRIATDEELEVFRSLDHRPFVSARIRSIFARAVVMPGGGGLPLVLSYFLDDGHWQQMGFHFYDASRADAGY